MRIIKTYEVPVTDTKPVRCMRDVSGFPQETISPHSLGAMLRLALLYQEEVKGSKQDIESWCAAHGYRLATAYELGWLYWHLVPDSMEQGALQQSIALVPDEKTGRHAICASAVYDGALMTTAKNPEKFFSPHFQVLIAPTT